MTTIRKSIDVPAARSETAAAWVTFIDSVLVGRRKLACDELTCVDLSNAELVSFDDLGDGRTRVNLTIPLGDDVSEGADEFLGHKASHDLVLFWDYVDSGEYRRDHAPAESVDAGLREDARRGRLTPRRARPDADPLSIRRSGRS